MRILAVALLDVDVMGRDVFIVETGPDEVVQYEVHRSGAVEALCAPQPAVSVMASIEKFNHGYLLDRPIEVAALSELSGWLGRFEPSSATEARLKA